MTSTAFGVPGSSARTLPHDSDAEQSVLGALMLDQNAISLVRDTLEPDDFYEERHQLIYAACRDLNDRGEPLDVVTLRAQLERRQSLGRAGGIDYLSDISTAVPTAASVRHYADIVIEHATKRRLVGVGREVADLGFDIALRADQATDIAEQRVFAVAQQKRSTEVSHIAPVLRETWTQLEAILGRREFVTGVRTNFMALDKMTQGLQPGELVILAARPSVGKTSFALNVARNAAVLARHPTIIFSLEMSKEALVQRLLCSEAAVDAWLLKTGQARAEDFQRIAAAMDRLNQADIYIDDQPGLSISQMRARARRMKAQHGISLIVVDYLQLMHGGRQESRVQEVSDISAGLKAIAKELAVPVVALSQLSRESERRQDRTPQLSDLRDSGCLVASTPVFLPDEGLTRPLGHLVGRTGFRVLALDETTWKLVPRTVTNSFPTGRKPVFELTTRLGRAVRATANHRFLTMHGWRRLDALTPDDHIALPRRLPARPEPTMSTSELALLGHLIGDGCTLPRHAVQYTTSDLSLAEGVALLADDVFGARVLPRIVRERTWYQVYLSSAERLARGRRNPVAEWLETLSVFGLRSHQKRVPPQVFEQPTERIAVFLKHLWATDGCIFGGAPEAASQPRIYYATTSRQLASDVQSLLLRLGICARLGRVAGTVSKAGYTVDIVTRSDQVTFLDRIGPLRPSAFEAGRTARRHGTALAGAHDVLPAAVWERYVFPAHAAAGGTRRSLAASLGVRYNGSAMGRANVTMERARKIAEVVSSPALRTLIDGDVIWDRVRSVVPSGEEEVYDLTVDQLHNFVAGDIVVHNSIEQDADVVLFLYREGMHNAEVDRSVTKLIVAKNRNGPVGDMELHFIPEQTSFRDPTRTRGE